MVRMGGCTSTSSRIDICPTSKSIYSSKVCNIDVSILQEVMQYFELLSGTYLYSAHYVHLLHFLLFLLLGQWVPLPASFCSYVCSLSCSHILATTQASFQCSGVSAIPSFICLSELCTCIGVFKSMPLDCSILL